jgi:hypothetical protein
MSVREDEVPVAPVYTFADAHMASGEQRRRILEAIVRQEKDRRERLQAITRVTMQATPTPITSSSARKVSTAR